MPGPVNSWGLGKAGGLKHHCGVCHAALASPAAKYTCIGRHVQPCSRYHEVLFIIGSAGRCKACRSSDEAHKRRHQNIAQSLYSISPLEGLELVNLARDRMQVRTGRFIQHTGPLDWSESGSTSGESEQKPPCRERRLAQKIGKASKHSSQKCAIVPAVIWEEIGFIIHSNTGNGITQTQCLSIVPQLTDETRMSLKPNAHGARPQNLKLSGSQLHLLQPDFSRKACHIITELKSFFNLPALAEDKSMRHAFLDTESLVVRDLEEGWKEDRETMKRKTAYYRYVSTRTYNHMISTGKIYDWDTGERLSQASDAAEGTDDNLNEQIPIEHHLMPAAEDAYVSNDNLLSNPDSTHCESDEAPNDSDSMPTVCEAPQKSPCDVKNACSDLAQFEATVRTSSSPTSNFCANESLEYPQQQRFQHPEDTTKTKSNTLSYVLDDVVVLSNSEDAKLPPLTNLEQRFAGISTESSEAGIELKDEKDAKNSLKNTADGLCVTVERQAAQIDTAKVCGDDICADGKHHSTQAPNSVDTPDDNHLSSSAEIKKETVELGSVILHCPDLNRSEADQLVNCMRNIFPGRKIWPSRAYSQKAFEALLPGGYNLPFGKAKVRVNTHFDHPLDYNESIPVASDTSDVYECKCWSCVDEQLTRTEELACVHDTPDVVQNHLQTSPTYWATWYGVNGILQFLAASPLCCLCRIRLEDRNRRICFWTEAQFYDATLVLRPGGTIKGPFAGASVVGLIKLFPEGHFVRLCVWHWLMTFPKTTMPESFARMWKRLVSSFEHELRANVAYQLKCDVNLPAVDRTIAADYGSLTSEAFQNRLQVFLTNDNDKVDCADSALKKVLFHFMHLDVKARDPAYCYCGSLAGDDAIVCQSSFCDYPTWCRGCILRIEGKKGPFTLSQGEKPQSHLADKEFAILCESGASVTPRLLDHSDSFEKFICKECRNVWQEVFESMTKSL